MRNYFITPTIKNLEEERENKELKPLSRTDMCRPLWLDAERLSKELNTED